MSVYKSFTSALEGTSVRVVGLGEATHGSSEFDEFRSEMTQSLLRSAGAGTVLLEASYAKTRAINNYVQTGQGTAEDAVESLGFWTWNTDELVDLVEWLRRFNQENPASVRVAGVDPQHSLELLTDIKDLLSSVDGVRYEDLTTEFDSFNSIESQSQYDDPKEWLVNFESLLRGVQKRLLDRDTASDRTLATIDRYIEILLQYSSICAARLFEEQGSPVAKRAKHMAANVERQVNQTPDRISVTWAHNAHVSTGTLSSGSCPPRMGRCLESRFGNEYYALGGEFKGGSFRAFPSDTEENQGLATFSLESLPENSCADELDSRSDGVSLRDFRTENLPEWTREQKLLHSVGSKHPGNDRDCYRLCSVQKEFDGMYFIESVSPQNDRQ